MVKKNENNAYTNIAIVDSVYDINRHIRKQSIKNIWARYYMLPDVLTNSLGRLYNIVEDRFVPDKNFKSLYSYTHDKTTMYSRFIDAKNLTVENGDGNYQTNVTEISKEACIAWYNTAYEGKNFLDVFTEKKYNIKSLKTFYSENGGSIDDYEIIHYKTDQNKNYDNNKPTDILQKTSLLFQKNKINTLVARFHGDNDGFEFIDSSKTNFGNSHGRNLLNKNKNGNINGYNNPYCRVWTYHHQYGTKRDKLIRPFENDINKSELIKFFRNDNSKERIENYSVLKNGFVKITPEKDGNNNYDTKRCMFSIENLAWKDVRSSELSEEQRGPNGGRIMWFPPYDLNFQETTQADWNETNFIGRGEPIYTYTNSKRTGSLSFTLLIDYPSIMDKFDKRAEKKDDNEDILRFFAGCDIPMQMGMNGYTTTHETQSQNDSESESPNEDESNIIKFSIYFPNNYSGHYQSINEIDRDWIDYLLHGKGCETVEGGNGYEMSDNGISHGVTEGDEYEVNGERITIFYRVDYDKKQRLSVNNLRDNNSSKLNNIRGSNSLSFNEIYNLLNSDNDLINLSSITNVEISGYATSQDSRYSNTLSQRRANTVREWINGILDISGITINTNVENVSDNDVNSEDSKRGRRVDVKITCNTPTTELMNEMAPTTASTPTETNSGNDITISAKPQYNEGDYFKNLDKIDNYTYQKIKDKIKYFEPAYHSISPEGFNSRLTFLQQCTRQGHTLERNANDIENIYSTAGNMAFGRPPFCVLRIGDFLNTKIIIRNINIVYQNGNGVQWDMNPEGIGVQPMYAKITMGIEIIGGQSLDAPISRLNNAVSFNYYANTSVYDDRADFAIYNGNGTTYDNFYNPET